MTKNRKMSNNTFECIICMTQQEMEHVKCRCNTCVCVDCMESYSAHTKSELNKLPVCPYCKDEYLLENFHGENILRDYCELIFDHIRGNQTLMEEINDDNDIGNIINRIQTEKRELIGRFPEAIGEIISIVFQKKLKDVMKINRESIVQRKKKTPNSRRCYSGTCQFGQMELNELGNYVCDTCAIEFCKDCEKPKLEDHVCTDDDKAGVVFMANVLKCPSCNAPCVKVSGCDNLTCANCHAKFHEYDGTEGGRGGHAGRKKILDMNKNKYTLHSEIGTKYPPNIRKTIKDFEDNIPQNPNLLPLAGFYLESNKDPNKMEMFRVYCEIKKTQKQTKEYHVCMLKLRQLHIDEKMTLEAINDIIK